MYCAIIGDIVNSRNLQNRNNVQIRLKNTLSKINKRYGSEIAAKFIITIGDEFQGLLKSPNNILEIIDDIKEVLYPIKLRIGIGIGQIDTEINPKMALGADGPAYHYARQAISKLKEISTQYENPKQDTMIIYFSNDDDVFISRNLINALWVAIYLIENNWSEKQRQAVNIVIREEMTQRYSANLLNIDQSSLQRRLNAAGYLTYKKLRMAIQESLIEIWRSINAI